MSAASLARTLDLLGVFVFALSGASMAARKGFDVVGLLVLALATGLGGGITRDLLLDEAPPIALRDDAYLVSVAVAAVVVLVGHPIVVRARRPVLLFDAVGLGVYAVAGAARAREAGLGPVAAVLVGTVTAVGGGVLRDVLAREIPAVFRPDIALYAIPAAGGAILTVVADQTGTYGTPAAAGIAGAVIVVRVLAMWRGWRGPSPRGGTAA